MSIPQKQLLESLHIQCLRVKPRYPGYGEALFRAVNQIIDSENRSRPGTTGVGQEVQRAVELLADLIVKSEGQTGGRR
jgi:hypothetical protein